MAQADWSLPEAFDPAREQSTVLALAKTKLTKNFKWSRAQCLYDAVTLAVLLHVFHRDDEALEICRAVGRIQFNGRFTLWSAVELALVLQARLLRRQGDATGAAECVQRVRAAGVVEARLRGNLLASHEAIQQGGNTKAEQAVRLRRAAELAFISELGGSDVCPVDELEQDWQHNLDRLRVLTGVATAS